MPKDEIKRPFYIGAIDEGTSSARFLVNKLFLHKENEINKFKLTSKSFNL